MLGDITDEEANNLIFIMSESFRDNFLMRELVESQLFPVTQYIGVACYLLYEGETSYSYQILKKIADEISPEEIARRSKCLGAPLNHLGFYAIPMLYLFGRAQVIYDNLFKRKKGDTDVIIESEAKKKETKFILDFWKRLSPNYLNDGKLTMKENKKIQCLTDDYINKLKDQMLPIDESNKDIIKKLKQTIALLTIFNFLFNAECRLGIFEHGPYYFEDNLDPLVFKEFSYLYSGDEVLGVDMSEFIPHKLSKIAPVPNVIFGMTLKGMNKIEFNDFGTLFADPSDFSSNITSIGIWTKEPIHPKDLRFPDTKGILTPLSIDILDKLSDFAKSATRELYINYTRWSTLKKLMLGSGLYANLNLAVPAAYAGIEDEFNWTWPMDYAEDKSLQTKLQNKEKIKFYIEKLEKFRLNAHPFGFRMVRGRKYRQKHPVYYYLDPTE
jgi:hypothetical protein